MTIVLGLTGSIGMGKSTAARMFQRLGVPIFDADAEVHRLMAAGGTAVDLVGEVFPGVVRNSAVDRKALGDRVFGKLDELRKLEAVLHPRVRHARDGFLKRARGRRIPLVVFDMPLLYETGGEALCDAVLVVSAPAMIQRARVLARSGMTEDKLASIIAQQVPDREKRRRADFVALTGLDKRTTLNTIRWVIRMLAPPSTEFDATDA